MDALLSYSELRSNIWKFKHIQCHVYFVCFQRSLKSVLKKQKRWEKTIPEETVPLQF